MKHKRFWQEASGNLPGPEQLGGYLSPFKKMASQKKSEYVATQIISAIQRGEFKKGDKLPSEQAMAKSMGVSRPSLREALGALRIMGVIDTVNGVGTVITKDHVDMITEGGASFLTSMLGQDINPFEILEARKILEPVVASYALNTITHENLLEMEAALLQMEEAKEGRNYNIYHDANKRFHHTIAASTQNKFLMNSIHSLLNLFTDSDFGAEMKRRYLTDSNYIEASLTVHRKIYECLKNGDKKGLMMAFAEHDRQVEKQLVGQ